MNEQNNLQTNKPIQNPKKIWIMLVALMITVLITGGAVYVWQRSELKKMEQPLQKQIDDLSQQETRNEVDQQRPAQTKQSLREQKIVFLKGNGINDKEAEIWSINLDGENEWNTGIKLNTGERFSAFHQSPDLKNVCFVDGNQEIGEEIYLYSIEENRVSQISNSFFKATDIYDGSWFIDCVWSTDSKSFSYKVSHHPHEFTEGGGIVEKNNPPKEFSSKMGVFIYDITNYKLTKIKNDNEISMFNWLLAENWVQSQTTLTVNNNTYSYENEYPTAKLFVNQSTIYETEYYIGHPSPLRLSPNTQKIAFADSNGTLIVFTVGNKNDLQKFNNAIVDGKWSRYEWLSNNEILFWQSRGGREYSNDKGFWYQGNLMVLDINTKEIKILTDDDKTYWRM